MTVREIALSLLMEYEGSGKYANLSLSSHKADSLSKSDRGFLTVLLYTAVERKLTYDYLISSLAGRNISDVSPRAKNILRLGLCQLMHLDSVPDFAAVNETVKLAGSRAERGFVNAILREALRRKDELPMPDKNKNIARYFSVFYSFPQELVKHFIKSFGEEKTEALLAYFNSVPKTTLSVNTAKISPDDFLSALKEKGYEAVRGEFSEISVNISGSVNPCEVFGYNEGYFFVQDEASAIAAYALGAKKDDIVIDVCACPGGKSFATAILSGGAKIHAFDLHESKLSLIRDGAKRLGVDISVSAKDATEPDFALFGTADKLICDVPCSGLGVLAKKPDLRYKDTESLKRLPELQLKILTATSQYLKSGGELIYSTCTLNEAENQEVVRAFLSQNAGFTPVDFSVGTLVSEGGMLTLIPSEHKTDGFFIAKIKKL